MRKFLKKLAKSAYIVGNVTSAVATFVLPNPVAGSQLLCGVLSTLIADKKLGKVADIVNLFGLNVGKASNDIDRNYHDYKY